METSNVVVAVRVRPMSVAEASRGGERVVMTSGRQVTVCDPVEAAQRESWRGSVESAAAAWRRDFQLDAVYDDESDCASGAQEQAAVYEGLGLPVLKRAFCGYDCSILAYGQTGSGKTYSITGPRCEDAGREEALRGLVPRICDGLFEAIEACGDEVRVEASYVEIYNEIVRDLLMPTGKPLRVREHPKLGAVVPELTTVAVSDREEVGALVAIGSRARATATTKANVRSSRSHAVFTLSIERRRREAGASSRAGWWDELEDPAGPGAVTRARIRLVDLAGSERVATTGTDGARLREAKSINRSLATLCDVVEALAANTRRSRSLGRDARGLDPERHKLASWSQIEHAHSSRASSTTGPDDLFAGQSPGSSLGRPSSSSRSPRPERKRQAFVPYRNSTLTWLLKDSLSGSGFVTMLACVSPAETHHDETVATLKYAERARRVATRPAAQYVAPRDVPPSRDDDRLDAASSLSGCGSPSVQSSRRRFQHLQRDHAGRSGSSSARSRRGRPPQHPLGPDSVRAVRDFSPARGMYSEDMPSSSTTPRGGGGFYKTRGSSKAPRTWPNLTNLNPDVEFAGTRFWPLGAGVSLVGSSPDAAVSLRGGDVLPKHAILATAAVSPDAALHREDATRFVVLVGLAGAVVHVDGRELDTASRACDAVVLTHGAHVVFAKRHAFRYEAYQDEANFQDDPAAEWLRAQRLVDDGPSAPLEPPPSSSSEERETSEYHPRLQSRTNRESAALADAVPAVAVDPLDNIRLQLERLPVEARAAVLADLAAAGGAVVDRKPRRVAPNTYPNDDAPSPRGPSCSELDDFEPHDSLAVLGPVATEAPPELLVADDARSDPAIDHDLAQSRRRLDMAQAQCVRLWSLHCFFSPAVRRLDALLGVGPPSPACSPPSPASLPTAPADL